jgi:hypothetical protein
LSRLGSGFALGHIDAGQSDIYLIVCTAEPFVKSLCQGILSSQFAKAVCQGAFSSQLVKALQLCQLLRAATWVVHR